MPRPFRSFTQFASLRTGVALLLVWGLVNLVQAALSPLDPDETYYWVYARRLSWGYFDHPPAVALLVSLGKDWLPGPLGLRLGHVLAGTITIAATYQLLGRPRGSDLWLAAGLVFAQPLLQVYGFVATPDGPLLLFAVLYLLSYRRFLRSPTPGAGAVWGLTMAGLLYSKYQGVVLILFSVLPNLGWLLRRPGAWVAALSGVLLYLPHLYWQYVHDFPSFRYHLSGRNTPYRVSHTLKYIADQLVVFSPFLVYHYAMTLLRDRAGADRFVRACRWLVVGVLLFFFVSTAKGRTEAHWTALLCFPLVYLTYRAATGHFRKWQPALRRLTLLSIVLLCVVRVLLMLPREWLPFPKPFDHAPWVRELAARAGERPVVVENSYRLASLYEFYSGGRPAWTFTNVYYRRNEYDLRSGDTLFHGREVLLLGRDNWQDTIARPFRTQKTHMKLRPVVDFQVAEGVDIRPTRPLPDTLRNSAFPLHLRLRNSLNLDLRASLPLDLYVTVHYGEAGLRFRRLTPLESTYFPAGDTLTVYHGPLRLPPILPAGPLRIGFGLGYRGMAPLEGQSAHYETYYLPPG